MRVKYRFDIHIYSDLEKDIPAAVESYNRAYVLKISDFFKKGTRWHFTVDAEFPKDFISPETLQNMRTDTIFRIGYFLR